MTRAVLAPGKAMLIGEYAVLEGEPAVVAAVSVYARAVLGGGVPSSGFIAAAMRFTSTSRAWPTGHRRGWRLAAICPGHTNRQFAAFSGVDRGS